MDNCRVLIVDDNLDSADCLRMLLSHHHCTIQMAHDGLAAVEAARQFAPHIVLLDIGLPKLDGYEACRRIRDLPNGDQTTIFGITGWDEPDDRIRSQHAGFTQIMVKPIDLSVLEKLLEESMLSRKTA